MDDKDIAKHRGDIFRIANTLPAGPGPTLPASIREDLKSMIAAFPPESAEWPAILSSLKTTFRGVAPKPEDLIKAIRTYLRLG